jgi:hypothetical protein
MPQARLVTLLSPLLSRSGYGNMAITMKISRHVHDAQRMQATTNSQRRLGGCRPSASAAQMLRGALRRRQVTFMLQLRCWKEGLTERLAHGVLINALRMFCIKRQLCGRGHWQGRS